MGSLALGHRLEAALTPSDLRLTGARLARKLQSSLRGGPSVAVIGFRRIGGDRSTLLAILQPADTVLGEDEAFFLARCRDRVQAVRLPVEDFRIHTGPWRRSGDRIFGGLHLTIGTRSAVGAVLLRKGLAGWRVADSRITEQGAARVPFRFATARRIGVTDRIYDYAELRPFHHGTYLLRDHEWTVRGDRIVETGARVRETPALALDRFIAAVRRGDGPRARRWCWPGAYRLAVARMRDLLRSGTELIPDSERDDAPTISLRAGETQSVDVELRRFRGRWRVACVGPPE